MAFSQNDKIRILCWKVFIFMYGSRNQDDSKVISCNNEVTDLYICITISIFIPIFFYYQL